MIHRIPWCCIDHAKKEIYSGYTSDLKTPRGAYNRVVANFGPEGDQREIEVSRVSKNRHMSSYDAESIRVLYRDLALNKHPDYVTVFTIV